MREDPRGRRRVKIPGVTLDTGALIGLERRRRRALALVTKAQRSGQRVTVPAVVLAEWYRGQNKIADRVLAGVVVEELTKSLAALAGEALGVVGAGPSAVDAIVMASAAQRGDVVLTSDFDDLELLRAVFPSVRVLRV